MLSRQHVYENRARDKWEKKKKKVKARDLTYVEKHNTEAGLKNLN